MNELEEDIFRKLSYDPSSGILTRKYKNSESETGCLNRFGYKVIRVGPKLYYAHRLAWFLYYKVWPKDQIDHINRIKTDNRIENLREVTNRENSKNTSRYNSGAYFVKKTGKWGSAVYDKGMNIYLGTFNTELEAQQAYKDYVYDEKSN